MRRNVRLTQGPPAIGPDFFDREELIERIWETLDRSSILLEAPRRFGKTSVMMELRDNPENDYAVFYFEIEHLESPEEFILKLLKQIQEDEEIWSRIKSGFSSIFDRLGENVDDIEFASFKLSLRDSEDLDWKDLGKDLVRAIDENDEKLLFILDEFPEMIKHMIENDKKEAEIFLNWFRQVRQTMSDDDNLRFILGGSVCLNNILNQIHCSEKINDIGRIRMQPFTEKKSEEFIEALFRGEEVEIDEGILNAIQEQIGTPIPYFIQVLTGAILKELEKPEEKITPKLVEKVYENKLLGSEYKTYFEHHYRRLDEYYSSIGGEKKIIDAAERILTEISKQSGVKKSHLYQLYLEETDQDIDEEGFGDIMALLEHEFYLEYNPEDNSYEFFSKVLKDWWYRHFGSLEYERED